MAPHESRYSQCALFMVAGILWLLFGGFSRVRNDYSGRLETELSSDVVQARCGEISASHLTLGRHRAGWRRNPSSLTAPNSVWNSISSLQVVLPTCVKSAH